MQPAPPVQHRRLTRINEFLARQDRIVYILLVATAAIGLTWVVWRHQYLARHEQRPQSATQLPPAVAPGVGAARK